MSFSSLLKQAEYFAYCRCVINACWVEHFLRAALGGKKQRAEEVRLLCSFYNILSFKKWQISNFDLWPISITKSDAFEPLVKNEVIFKNWLSFTQHERLNKPVTREVQSNPGSRGSFLHPGGWALSFLATPRLGSPEPSKPRELCAWSTLWP